MRLDEIRLPTFVLSRATAYRSYNYMLRVKEIRKTNFRNASAKRKLLTELGQNGICLICLVQIS